MTYLRGLLIWMILMSAEALHGILRVIFLEPYVGDFKARQIAVFTGSAMILVIALATSKWLRADGLRQLLCVGAMWLGLTLGFEIFLGRFVIGYSWQRVASDYKLFEGGLLPIGMLILAAAPLVAAKIRGSGKLSSEVPF